MAALDFPSSPTIGQTYTANGNSWQWDGSSWNAILVADLGSVAGTLSASNGGTGLTSPGTSGNVLTSTGSAWISSAPAAVAYRL
jgi:hypothetical protein